MLCALMTKYHLKIYVSFSSFLSPPFLPLVEAAATGRALRSLLSSPLTTTDTRTVLNDN